MLKSVIKEIFIILLLSIAILLILGILFYEYIPINKTIPEKEAYVTPENVKKEIDESISDDDKPLNITYSITDSDLELYKQSSEHTEGKANPFALEETTDKTENSHQNTEQNVSDGNDEKNENTSNTFWDDDGLK